MSSNVMKDRASAADGIAAVDAPELRVFVMALFFIFGGITSLNDVIIPKLKELFSLDHMQAMLVQSAFFAAYFTVSLPAAALVRRLGYMRGAVVGLLTDDARLPAVRSGLGQPAVRPVPRSRCSCWRAASPSSRWSPIRLISLLGPKATAHSRLTFAQAFNSLGTTVFPYFGAIVILGRLADMKTPRNCPARRSTPIAPPKRKPWRDAYLGLAAALAIIAGAVWLHRDRLKGESHEGGLDPFRLRSLEAGALRLWNRRDLPLCRRGSGDRLADRALSRTDPMCSALSEQAAGKLIPVYWGGALVGRFIGSAALRLASPASSWPSTRWAPWR